MNSLHCEYRIITDGNVQSKIHQPRRVPVALTLRSRINQKLDELVEHNIIVPDATEETEWVSGMLVVTRPNKKEICLNTRDLNKAIKRKHYTSRPLSRKLPPHSLKLRSSQLLMPKKLHLAAMRLQDNVEHSPSRAIADTEKRNYALIKKEFWR